MLAEAEEGEGRGGLRHEHLNLLFKMRENVWGIAWSFCWFCFEMDGRGEGRAGVIFSVVWLVWLVGWWVRG